MPPPPFLHTRTSREQHALEAALVADFYREMADDDEDDADAGDEAAGTTTGDLAAPNEAASSAQRGELLVLLRDRHARYLQGALGTLPGGFISLGASRPWIAYWALHGLALLRAPLPPALDASQVVAFLASCQHPEGGYGGSPGQLAHLAPTYAAVSALVTLGGQEALASIDRRGVWAFLNRMAVPPEHGGGFRMHDGGESDVRCCYTALAVAKHLALDVRALAARSGCVDYIRRCQTYEGGIGGEPGNEAHGGYTFCGLAALVLAGAPHALDLPALLRWAAQRQGWVEGGFNGRTNKLVDGCYSFWQGGVFPLLQQLLLLRPEGGQQSSMHSVPADLEACCVGATYPARTAPSHWQQQPEEQQQQQQIVVPDLPDLSRVQGPVDQANQDAEQLNAACDALAAAVLADPDPAPSSSSTPEPAAAAEAASRQQLVERAQAAEEAADYADENARIAAASAALLFPCRLPPSSASPAAANPLFNVAALQCWVLRACQQLKGGLRDKPGKGADYYHSCYCLSGLAAAQHIPGGGVEGPPAPAPGDGIPGVPPSSGNELARADPLLNVVVDRLREAQAFFASAEACC